MSAAGLSGASARPRANGYWGMMIFALAEATLVGSVVGSYLDLRVTTARWPPAGTSEPALLAPILLTGLLLASLLPFRLGLGAARAGRRRHALAYVGLAAAVQTAYLALQIHLFLGNLAQFTPAQSAYASVYYVLLGAAHAHVAVGLLLDAWLLLRLAVRLTRYRLVALEAIFLYWTVVGGLTVLVLVTELSPRL